VTSADALDGLWEELGRRGIVFGMARVKQNLRDQLAAAGLVERIGEKRIFPTLPTAVGPAAPVSVPLVASQRTANRGERGTAAPR
jgi:hypothetical protein